MLVEDTTLLYSIDHPDPENNFTVTVVPINEVGAGQPKIYVQITFLHKDKLVNLKSSVRLSATQGTFSLEEKTNIYPAGTNRFNIKNNIILKCHLLKFTALSTKTPSSTDESQLQIPDTGDRQYTVH